MLHSTQESKRVRERAVSMKMGGLAWQDVAGRGIQ